MPHRYVPSWMAVVATFLIMFLYAPLIVVVLYAFNSGANLTWPPQGFSVRWFEEVFADDLFRAAFLTSMESALVSSVISTIAGTAAAFVFTRRHSRLSSLVSGLSRLPLMLPPLFIGVGFVALMTVTSTTPSISTIILGHTIVTVPFVTIVVVARLHDFEIELEQAARDLGAGPWQTIRRITLPIVAPAIIGGFLLAFAFSFDEVLVTNFTSGASSTVPIYILGRLHRYIDPGANAVAMILLLIPWLSFAVAALFMKRSGGSIEEVLGQRVM